MKRVMIVGCFILMVSGVYAVDYNDWTGLAVGPNEATNWFNADNWSIGTPNFAHYFAYIDEDGAVVDINPILSDPNDPQSPVLVAQAQRIRTLACTLNVNPGAVLESAEATNLHYEDIDAGVATMNLYGTFNTAGLFMSPRKKGHVHLTMYPGSVYEQRYPVNGILPNQFEVRGEGLTGASASSFLFDMLGGVLYTREFKWARQNAKATLNLVDGEINLIDTVNSDGSKDFLISYADPYDRGMVNQTGGILKCDQLYICGDPDAATGTDTGDGEFGYAIYNLEGGELNCRQILSNSTAFDPSRHQVNLINGKLNFAEWDASMGTMYNMGTIVSPGHYSNNAPMDETMELTIEADYVDSPIVDSNGIPTLVFDLGSASDYDRITVQGGVTLDSELKVNLVDGFELSLQPTDVFTIVSSDNATTGGFTNLDGNSRINAYAGGNLETNFLVTVDNLSTPKTIVLSDALLTNVPPVITAEDVYTYDAVKDSILIDTEVSHHNLGIVDYSWAVISTPDPNSTITPDPTTLTTNDITIGVNMLGDYALELTATDTVTGKFSTVEILVAVRADACEAAKADPAFALLIGDVDGDCDVDLVDLSILAGSWQTCYDVTCP